MSNFSTRLKNRDYPATTVEKHLSEVIFADRKKALEQRHKNASKKILPFAVTQYHPALPNLKNIVMGKWHLIQNQPYLRNIFKEPPLISYRKGKSLKDTQVRANAIKVLRPIYLRTAGVVQACQLNLEFQPVCSVSVPLGNKTDQKLSSPLLI